MKINFVRFISLILALVFVLCSCAKIDNQGSNNSDVPTDSNDDIDDSSDVSQDSSSVLPTDSSSDADSTELEIYIPRADKEIKNILMIGNSFCTYYPEELYGIAKADGYELVIASLYESGCPVADHWNWWLQKKAEYTLYITSAKYNKGDNKQDVYKGKLITLQDSLDYAKKELGADWDVITLQQHFNPERATNYNKGRMDTVYYAKKLFDKIRTGHSESLLFWHETWAYQVGYAVADKYIENPKTDIPIPDVETQTLTYENIKKISKEIEEENNVNMIPCADAWQIARADARVGDVLCARLGENGNLGDYYHDGDIGGGQYLNACVWYEVLMGESCIGNTWRPKNYTLSEEKIVALQEAAHAAVAAVYGPGYAK